jgi:hypothetical protein
MRAISDFPSSVQLLVHYKEDEYRQVAVTNPQTGVESSPVETTLAVRLPPSSPPSSATIRLSPVPGRRRPAPRTG